MNLDDMRPWDVLLKRIIWRQLGEINGRKILDFGSGQGITACYLAGENQVTAIEPDSESVSNRMKEKDYRQLCGSTELLKEFPDETFDMVVCHNVLEYAADRERIVREFSRILKQDGYISIVKHNRPGRVMQMVVLLNDFEQAGSLLEGNDGLSAQFGPIHYYEDADIESWCPDLRIERVMGARCFWDLQQNQELHTDAEWQDRMIEMELRVSKIQEYRQIAFFHHLLIRKRRRVRFYDEVQDELLKFAVIMAVSERKLVFCKHKQRDTWEVPGGHREAGEDILDTARRELYEETGAVEFEIEPVCVYSVTAPDNLNGGEESFGMLYFADIKRFEPEIHSEIEKIALLSGLPESWTYPEIQPKLLEEAGRRNKHFSKILRGCNLL
ncbi:MAG: methyltransferase domain-containing protein [Firmicutes bacterium]|nr:methyltransferase domain-containing protein [Bacillota bacterium]